MENSQIKKRKKIKKKVHYTDDQEVIKVKERALNTCGQVQTRPSRAGAGSCNMTHKLKSVKSCQLRSQSDILTECFSNLISNPVLI